MKFNDWMCPACKGYQQAYQPIFDKYEQSNPGEVKLVTKDWPWNTNCNTNVMQTFLGHEESCNAAVAVRLARDHGKGEDMITWLFANQERLGELGRTRPADAEKEIRAKASELSGVADFAHEYSVRMNGIASDVATGKILNVNSTPTYFINGVRVTDANAAQIPPQVLRPRHQAGAQADDGQVGAGPNAHGVSRQHPATHQGLSRRLLASATASRARRLTFDIRPASVFGLLGPNGAGKSTTLKLLDEPDLADVRHGRGPRPAARRRRARGSALDFFPSTRRSTTT